MLLGPPSELISSVLLRFQVLSASLQPFPQEKSILGTTYDASHFIFYVRS